MTETMASRDARRNMDVLSRLRLKGFGLAIDDFGSGYSSLKRLRESPFSILKIDRSFVADFTTCRDSLAIIKAIVDLARGMNLICVAEGVETEEAATRLEALGVTVLQGYHLSRPLRPEALHDWAASWCSEGVPGAKRSKAS
jgi:EAL domain-containing protein (putative c-di-GMP-specific phosphodiesterase class I)